MPSMGSTEVKSIADDLVEAIESSAGSSKLLESLEDYSCSDKIRWNSVEGFKGAVCGAKVSILGSPESPLFVSEDFLQALSKKWRNDKILPIHTLKIIHAEVSLLAFKKFRTSLNRQGSYCQLISLCLQDATLNKGIFMELALCQPLACKLQKLDLSRNADLTFPEPGQLRIMLDCMPSMELLYLDHIGFLSHDLERLMAALRASRAGKCVRSLRIGPPVYGIFSQETNRNAEDLQHFFTSCCPKLLLLVGWELASSTPSSGDGWIWKELGNGSLQGSQLTQEEIDALDVPKGHISPQDALRQAGREADEAENIVQDHVDNAANEQIGGAVKPSTSHCQVNSRPTVQNGSAANYQHQGSRQLRQQQHHMVPQRRRTKSGQSRPPSSGRDFLDTGNAPRRHARAKPQSSSFEDHFHGAVDLEGEFEEDDARGRLVSERQRDFLQEVDRSRREQISSRAPRTGKPRPPKVANEQSQPGERSPAVFEVHSGSEASPERQIYGGSEEQLAEDEELRLPVRPEDTPTKDLAIIDDGETELEFGLDAEKERRRARRRKHLTEAEELRAFAFEDDETAREHQARGHFGLPQSSVRASRLRANAAERLQQERLLREARRSHPPIDATESSGGDLEPMAQPSQHVSADSRPDNAGRQQGRPSSSKRGGASVHRLVDIAAGGRSRSIDRLADLDDSDSGDSRSDDDGSRDSCRPPSNKKRRVTIFESEEQNEDSLPARMTPAKIKDQKESSSQHMTPGDAWIESPKSQPNISLKESKAGAALPTLQARPGKEHSPQPTQEKAHEREMSDGISGRCLSGSTSEPRTGSAASGDKGVKRLTEIERLLTLWAGDKYLDEHPANRRAMGVEMLPEGAKRVRRKPSRLVDEEGLEPQVQKRKACSTEDSLLLQWTPASDWPSSDSDDDRPLAVALGVKRPIAFDTDEAKPIRNTSDGALLIDLQKPPPLENEHPQMPADWPVQSHRPQPFLRAKMYTAPTPSSDLEIDKRDDSEQGVAPEEESAVLSNSKEVGRSPQLAQVSPAVQALPAPAAFPAQPSLSTDMALEEEKRSETPGKRKGARLQETLMRIGLRSILSPSKQEATISTSNVEIAAPPFSSPPENYASREYAPAAERLLEPEAAVKAACLSSLESLTPDASITPSQTVASKAATGRAGVLPDAAEPTNLQSTRDMERAGTANMQQDRVGLASYVHPAREEPGMQQEYAGSLPVLQRPGDEQADGRDSRDRHANPDYLCHQEDGHPASPAGLSPARPRREAQVSDQAGNTDSLILGQHLDTTVPQSTAEAHAAAEHRADKQIVPPIIPDSEEEEEMAHA